MDVQDPCTWPGATWRASVSASCQGCASRLSKKLQIHAGSPRGTRQLSKRQQGTRQLSERQAGCSDRAHNWRVASQGGLTASIPSHRQPDISVLFSEECQQLEGLCGAPSRANTPRVAEFATRSDSEGRQPDSGGITACSLWSDCLENRYSRRPASAAEQVQHIHPGCAASRDSCRCQAAGHSSLCSGRAETSGGASHIAAIGGASSRGTSANSAARRVDSSFLAKLFERGSSAHLEQFSEQLDDRWHDYRGCHCTSFVRRPFSSRGCHDSSWSDQSQFQCWAEMDHAGDDKHADPKAHQVSLQQGRQSACVEQLSQHLDDRWCSSGGLLVATLLRGRLRASWHDHSSRCSESSIERRHEVDHARFNRHSPTEGGRRNSNSFDNRGGCQTTADARGSGTLGAATNHSPANCGRSWTHSDVFA
mmetsp:Transcript_23442/g.42761  ORF Transcript_23442/g.42761 Transcript_23442/m.42761 type:complete len:422 (+) Transcript_23442:129-1394(+)